MGTYQEGGNTMALTQMIKKAIRGVDRFSPYPLFYPFVMSDNEKKVFDKAIKHSKNYLEFGLGGSTLRALQKSGAKIYSVESCPRWIAQMRRYLLLRYCEEKRLFILPVDIGKTCEWGYPESEFSRHLFPDYSSCVFRMVDAGTLDLALVDGRFRVACILKIILACHENRNFRILIHDFWNRKHYHEVLKYLEVVERVDTIGLFSIKSGVDLTAVRKDYETYKFDPS
jgi:hypothetical protein